MEAASGAARAAGFTARSVKSPILLLLLLAIPPAVPVAGGAGPSFDCDEAEGTVEEMICADSTLAALDLEMAVVWQEVLDRAEEAGRDPTRAEQRGWIKGRNDCWKSDDVRGCIVESYRLRIAELQARWGLVPSRGPFRFACEDAGGSRLTVTYFDTSPPIALLVRDGETAVCYQVPAASGARYQGRDISFWTKGRTARLIRGLDEEDVPCRPTEQDQ